jgi:hypothetical protein
VGAGCGGVGEQRTKAIRCGACYYSIVLNAHRVTSMADTDIDAAKKRNNAERKEKKRMTCISLVYFLGFSEISLLHNVLRFLKLCTEGA